MTIKIPGPKPIGTAEVYQFLSESDPGLLHYTLVHSNGTIECTCKGWQFNESCWHVRAVSSNYFSCLCGRRFKTSRGLSNHMRIHRR